LKCNFEDITASEALEQLTREQLLSFYDKYIYVKSPERRKLCIGVYSTQHADDTHADGMEERHVDDEKVLCF
jgi:hypothetical protein